MSYIRSGMAVALASLLAGFRPAEARGSYTGYSGAPGSRGTCASSCHGSSGGSIEIVGFPTSYDPGVTYTVTVRRVGGSRISNFNASTRVGSGSANAGLIAAGLNTSTYNATGETNGIHFTSANRDSGLFAWTAPDPGVGDVKLYLAGLQGTSMSGPNTAIVLTATQSPTGVVEGRSRPVLGPALRVSPSHATSRLVFHIRNPSFRAARIAVLDDCGRTVARLAVPKDKSADQAVLWNARDSRGRRLPAGDYSALLLTVNGRCNARFTIAN